MGVKERMVKGTVKGAGLGSEEEWELIELMVRGGVLEGEEEKERKEILGRDIYDIGILAGDMGVKGGKKVEKALLEAGGRE